MARSCLSSISILGFAAAWACAQGLSVATFSINMAGGAYGMAADIEMTQNGGTIATTLNGKAYNIAFDFLGVRGYGNTTTLDIILHNAYNDVLHFVDDTAALTNSGRSGNLVLIWGTGLFHDSNGHLNYSFLC